MKIVCISDLHLDQRTAGVDRYDDTCEAIDCSVTAAIKMNADAMLMCGDLTDPNNVRSHRASAKAIEMQRRLHKHGVLPIYLAGNHDVIEDGSGMTTMSALAATGIGYVIERPTTFNLVDKGQATGCNVIALPFTATSHAYDPGDYIRAVATENTRFLMQPLLIIGHLNAEGIEPGSETTEMPRGRDVYWPLDAIDECFPHAVMVGGHYHTPQVYKGLHIIGSVARMSFAERDNDLGYLVLEI